MWTTFQLIITLYIALFVPETDPELKKMLDEAKAKKKEATGGPGIKRQDSISKRRAGKKTKNKRKKFKNTLMRSSSHKKLFEYDPTVVMETCETEEDLSESDEEETEPDLK